MDVRCISFRVCDREMNMSLSEWSVCLGLYTGEQEAQGACFGRDIGLPRDNLDFDLLAAWRSMMYENAPEYIPTTSRATDISDPVLRLAQVFLGYNLLGQANTSSTITMAELYFMWCMKEQRKVHLGYWIARACHNIATHPARHLNTCHILGALGQSCEDKAEEPKDNWKARMEELMLPQRELLEAQGEQLARVVTALESPVTLTQEQVRLQQQATPQGSRRPLALAGTAPKDSNPRSKKK